MLDGDVVRPYIQILQSVKTGGVRARGRLHPGFEVDGGHPRVGDDSALRVGNHATDGGEVRLRQTYRSYRKYDCDYCCDTAEQWWSPWGKTLYASLTATF